MWWNKIVFGWSAYHVVLWFLTYSVLGWVVESIYMSVCNRKITNRGFSRGPMCPIYGFGALTVFFLLRPYSANPVRLFFMGMFVATALEFITALVMQKVFGEIWWDYNEKPFNYRGIICLESSVAWGVYTVGLFLFLHNIVVGIVDRIPPFMGKLGGSLIIMAYVMDFMIVLYREKRDDIPEHVYDKVYEVKENLLNWFGSEE